MADVVPICGPCSISQRACIYASEPRPARLPDTQPDGSIARHVTDVPDGTSSVSGATPEQVIPGQHPLFSAPIADHSFQGCSPEGGSQLLTADLASTRWLDLLAADAAQADEGFSLAPSLTLEQQTSPAEGYRDLLQGPGQVDVGVTLSTESPTKERYAWRSEEDIILQPHEARLFRSFAERAASWVRYRMIIWIIPLFTC